MKGFDLIDAVLNQEEAVVVKSLIVSKRGSEEKLIWDYTRIGLFLVKSTYCIECQLRRYGLGENSMMHQSSLVWKKLWDLQ